MDNLKQQLKQAQQNFDYADENHINAAIYELKATEEKFNAMVREAKSDERKMFCRNRG